MLVYFNKTWYLFILRFLLFITECILFVFLSSTIQTALYNLFNIGTIGMIIGGFLGIILSYALLSYIDKVILLVLKIWIIAIFVSVTNETNDRALSLVSHYFPQISVVIIVNSILRKITPSLIQFLFSEFEKMESLKFLTRFKNNIFIQSFLKNIVDFVDECAIFYIFKMGNDSEDTFLTLGRGVLFYLKCFPSLLIRSIQIIIFAFCIFIGVFICAFTFTASGNQGLINIIFSLLIAYFITIMLSKLLLELFKLSLMLSKFNDCIVQDKVNTKTNSDSNLEENSDSNSPNYNTSNSVESFLNQNDTIEDLYSDLLSQSRARSNKIKRQPTTTTFSIQETEYQQQADVTNNDTDNSNLEYFTNISAMDISRVLQELQDLGIHSFDKFLNF